MEEVCPECAESPPSLEFLFGRRYACNDCGFEFSLSDGECSSADVDADDGSYDSDVESCPECSDVGGIDTECKGCGRNGLGLRF